MFSIVRALIDRFKALFVTHAALELEAELVVAGAERQADLLRRAKQYEQEGLAVVAEHLRLQAESQSIDRPLNQVLTSIAHLQADQAATSKPATPTTPVVAEFAPPALAAPAAEPTITSAPVLDPVPSMAGAASRLASRKKNRKS